MLTADSAGSVRSCRQIRSGSTAPTVARKNTVKQSCSFIAFLFVALCSGCFDLLSPDDAIIRRQLRQAGVKYRLVKADKGIIQTPLSLRDNECVILSPVAHGAAKMYYLESPVTNLSFLARMPVRTLYLLHTTVQDLSPLRTTPLEVFTFRPLHITNGIDVIRSMSTLTNINAMSRDAFWKKWDAGDFQREPHR